MKIEPGQTVLLTGASGGLGKHIARAVAAFDVKLALVAYPGVELGDLREEVAAASREAISISADLRRADERHRVLDEVRSKLGEIDLLINNAGVEYTGELHLLSEDDLQSVVNVNLLAPIILSKLVLPAMLERKRGHIVNMSSLAGKSVPAYQEPYAATKAGLVGFTRALRQSYRGTGVSASVICPGFVEAGIYSRLKEKSGHSAPWLMGSTSPEKVARAVVRAIERDRPEVIVNRFPVRHILALTELSPGLGAWIVRFIGANDFFRKVIESEESAEG